MNETYTAADIKILATGQVVHRWVWAEVGLLATQYRRSEEWIRRGLLACDAAGVSHDYFVDRYLRKLPIPLHPGVDAAMRELLASEDAPRRPQKSPRSDFPEETIPAPPLAASVAGARFQAAGV